MQAIDKKPRLSFWQIWNMSFVFLGILFGFALQGGFMSRIFQTLGADKDAIPMLWIAAPLTGLLVQPIVGYLSDRTWHPRFGRRKPFFLIGAMLSTIALFFCPLFICPLDGGRSTLDLRCLDQYQYGAFQSFGGWQTSWQSAFLWIRCSDTHNRHRNPGSK